MPAFDFQHPDYPAEFQRRLDLLQRIRTAVAAETADIAVTGAPATFMPQLKAHYRLNPARFISDWGVTLDYRNVEIDLPSLIPFVLFPRQEEWVAWVVDAWRNRRPGLTEKSRECGVSWLSIALACTLCLHYDGLAVGFGSRKAEYIDRLGFPKSLFHKARVFMQNLPREFRGGWTMDDAPLMRLGFPQTGSAISGESGDGIGRGDRASIYFVDEAAYLERPDLIEASLSQTTNCRIDVSSVNGMANAFAQKRHSGKVDVFTFHWRDDPRKSEEWYAKQVRELAPHIVAQEIDINYQASVENVVIPNAWVQAAVDSHLKLGIANSGSRQAALDVSDLGRDLNAFCGAYGFLIELMEEWSGKEGDILATVQRAFLLCDMHQYDGFLYDADGLGAGVRGDSRSLNAARKAAGQKQLLVSPFWGSGPVAYPDRSDVPGRTNKDFFANFKAQAWWSLRTRFQKTFRAVVEGEPIKAEDLISISSRLPNLAQLLNELSQPTYDVNGVGKIVIDKSPDGMRSPNLADSVMIRFAPGQRRPLNISSGALQRFATPADAVARAGGSRISPEALQRFAR